MIMTKMELRTKLEALVQATADRRVDEVELASSLQVITNQYTEAVEQRYFVTQPYRHSVTGDAMLA